MAILLRDVALSVRLAWGDRLFWTTRQQAEGESRWMISVVGRIVV
jgi:hypothetical protein